VHGKESDLFNISFRPGTNSLEFQNSVSHNYTLKIGPNTTKYYIVFPEHFLNENS
jgi:hypothetical protein